MYVVANTSGLCCRHYFTHAVLTGHMITGVLKMEIRNNDFICKKYACVPLSIIHFVCLNIKDIANRHVNTTFGNITPK